MFDFLFSEGAVALLLAAGCGCFVVLTLGQIRRRKPEQIEAWRDELPPALRFMQPLIRPLAKRFGGSLERQRVLKGRLRAAGIDYVILPAEFAALRWLGLLIGLVLAAWPTLILQTGQGLTATLFTLLPLIGFTYPDMWLNDAIKKRHNLISRQFPFFLDLLTLSMRAGLTFPSAISQALPRLPVGPVKAEFERVVRETRTGKSRREALIGMAKRNQMMALTNFVAAVNQAEETGAVLGDVLVAQSQQRRNERFLLAEKLAGQAPVKMLLPLMGLLFPITFVIIGFPIVMKFLDSPAAGMFK